MARISEAKIRNSRSAASALTASRRRRCKRFFPDYVKLTVSHTRHIAADPTTRLFAALLARIAQSLNIRMLAQAPKPPAQSATQHAQPGTAWPKQHPLPRLRLVPHSSIAEMGDPIAHSDYP